MKEQQKKVLFSILAATISFELVHIIIPYIIKKSHLALNEYVHTIFVCIIIAVINHVFLVKLLVVNPATVLLGIPFQWFLFFAQKEIIGPIWGLRGGAAILGDMKFYAHWYLMPFLVVGIGFIVALRNKKKNTPKEE